MFKTIFGYELKYWFRNPPFYIYLSGVFLLSGFVMAGISGAFDEETLSQLRLSNSPMSIFSLINIFNKLLLFLIPAVIGHSVYRDYSNNAHSLLYSYPFTKFDYLAGKFLSSFLIICAVSLMVPFGFIAGTQLPGVKEFLLVPFDPVVYLQISFVYLIPNLFFFGTVVFGIVLFSRNIYAGFISVIILFIARESVLKLFIGVESSPAFLLLDPFCESATYFYTRSFSAAELNFVNIPLEPLIIYNRLIWLAAAVSVLGLTGRNFSFSQNSISFKIKNKSPERIVKNNFGSIDKIKLPGVNYIFSFIQQLKVTWKLSVLNFKYIISSGTFISILVAGSLFEMIVLMQMNPQYETRVLPVTWVMLAFPVFFFSILINLMTFLYAGVLIHHDKASHINELMDITPVPDWVFLVSKFFALIKMQALVLTVVMIAGILVQIYNGYYKFEISHYLFDLFGIHLIGFIIWAAAALFVQTMIPNLYLSLLVLVLSFFGMAELSRLGFEKFVFRFNQNPEPDFFLKYSDLSGYGHSLISYFTYKTYWIFSGIVIFFLTLLFFQRGMTQSFGERLILAKQRFAGFAGVGLIVSTILFLSIGFWIFKMDNASNRKFSETEKQKIISEADGKYKKYAQTVQPRITSVKINMNLFPETLNFNSDGVYSVKNKSNQKIDTLLVNYGFDVNTKYRFDRETKIISRDTASHFDVILLNEGLLPGDSMKLFFEVENIPNTFLYKNSPVETDGTFITSEIFPGLGYYSADTYSNPSDSADLKNHYRSIDSDFIDFEAIVSTSGDQIAVAPGYLKKEWVENGRNYFKYNSEEKVTNDYVFNSGIYEVRKDKLNNVELEIYYHRGHEYNLDNLMNGMKAALEYNEKYFGTYQHRQVRIIEYSRAQGNFAMSFANTIPYSESNFIMDIDDSETGGLNLPFLGAAHELSHQWWGHQVIPAGVNGARMITESMAEYISLKVLEHQYGKAKANKFLKKALDIYLKKRSLDSEVEKPLMYNIGLSKSYIPYQKGSIVLFAMSEYLGEENLNNALKKYFNKVKFQEAPYTTSVEMVDIIREVTPDSLQYLIKDMFETVTFYDNKILNVTASELTDGKYKVDIEFAVSKYRIDSTGNKIYEDKSDDAITYLGENQEAGISSLPLKDYIEISVYSKQNTTSTAELIYNKKLKIVEIHNVATIITNKKPSAVAIDQFITLIDFDINDNMYIIKY